MKMNKIKNPVFWMGMLSVVLLAAGIDPQTLTSWSVVWEKLVAIASNPYTLAMVIVALYSNFNDNGTAKLDIPFKRK